MGDDRSAAAFALEGFEDVVEIGRGGFATVYRAHQPSFRRTVAIKVLTGGGAERLDEVARQRFERECHAMGMLSDHPNIVTVYQAGFTDREQPYIVMAYMAAGSLEDRLKKGGPLPYAEVATIGVGLAGALEAAHQGQVLHRDLKPANVLVSPWGESKLTDFGIARVAGGHETRSGVITASIAHAPPEVLDGQRPTVAADVYALGSTLFALLCSRPPFSHETDESLVPMLQRIVQAPVPDLRPRGIPHEICAVIEQAMAKDPAERQPSAVELGRAMQRAQQGFGLPVTPILLQPGTPAELPPPARDGASSGPSLSRPPGGTSDRIVPPHLRQSHDRALSEDVPAAARSATDVPAPSQAQAPPADGQTVAAGEEGGDGREATLATAHHDLVGRPFGAASLEAAQDARATGAHPSALPPPGSGSSDRSGGPPPRRRALLIPVLAVVLLAAIVAVTVLLLDAEDDAALAGEPTLRWRFDAGGFVASTPLVWEGSVFAASQNRDVHAIDRDTGEMQWSFTTDGIVFASPAIADGTVYIGSYDGLLYAFDARSGDVRWTFETLKEVQSTATIVDGVVYVGSNDGQLYAVDAQTGEARWNFGTGGQVWSRPAVVDGIVYIGSGDEHVYGVDADTGEQVWRYRTGGGVFGSPAVVDGVVYVGSSDGVLYALDAGNGEEVRTFETDDIVSSSPAVVDGVAYVGSFDGGVYAFDVSTGERRWRFATGDQVFSSPSVSEGVVYVGSHDGSLYAIDAATGEQRWSYETGDVVGSSPRVADGVVYVGSDDGGVYALELPQS